MIRHHRGGFQGGNTKIVGNNISLLGPIKAVTTMPIQFSIKFRNFGYGAMCINTFVLILIQCYVLYFGQGPSHIFRCSKSNTYKEGFLFLASP